MWANLHGVFKRILVVLISLTSVNCSNNALSEFANKKDNASLYHSTLTALNEGLYDDAVDYCADMSADFLAGQGLYVCASAYAGRCGYSMTGVIADLTSYDPSTDPVKVLEFFMEQYHGSTLSRMADCETATQMLRGAGAATARTDDQNFMLILMGLTHLGVVMNTIFDTDDDDDPDHATVDPCNAGHLTNSQASQVGRAFWEIYRSAEAVNSTLTADLVTALDAMSAAIDLVGAQYNFLVDTADPDAFTANQLRGIRTLIKEGQAAGLGYACNNFVACLCP